MGGDIRSIVLGVIVLTPGTIRVSVIVCGILPFSVYITLPVWMKRSACRGPADSPGRFGAMAVAAVGNGAVRLRPSARRVARAWPSTALPRAKFTTGSPKPWFAKPLPVIVKLGGGVAKSAVVGAMVLTPGATGVLLTVRLTLPSRLKLFVLICR